MTEPPFRFDEVGAWSVLKLEIIEKYGAAYTKSFVNAPRLKKFYIDGFSGLWWRRSSSRFHQRQIRRLGSPRLRHHRRNRILRRAVDEPVCGELLILAKSVIRHTQARARRLTRVAL